MKVLVTGGAGFIGSHLVEALVRRGRRVRVLDNLSEGKLSNLAGVRGRIEFIRGDLRDPKTLRRAVRGTRLVFHQAALRSVPKSVGSVLEYHDVNATGTLLLFQLAREAGVRRVVYASSSSVYGDRTPLPQKETFLTAPQSPYAASKMTTEIYGGMFTRLFGLETVGLRYFNVFGPRQDPGGAYAAVIPLWIATLLKRKPVFINGDGETSRDFCYVANVVQANLLAATAATPAAGHEVYNIAVGERATLNELFELIQAGLRQRDAALPVQKPVCRDFRPGDVRHSLADIGKARRDLGYEPTHRLDQGLAAALDWYRGNVV